MKKILAIIFTCTILITSLTYVSATYLGFDVKGYTVAINGEITEYTSVIRDGTHYVPMRKVFEKLGTRIYYRGRDSQILALSRDGDLVSHILGSNIVTLNGEEKVFENTSILENSETYMPIDMVSTVFCVDGVFYDNYKLNIQKYFFNNEYHAIIKDVLDLCTSSNFYPEKFQRYINYHSQKPEYSIDEVFYRVNLGLDYPFYENMTTIEHPYELLVLVNKYNKLPSGFSQYNLVNMDREYTAKDGKEYLLASVANENYVKMANAVKSAGLSMKVVSAYRTEAYQRNLYNNKVRTSGKVYADNYSARAGHSEHQTGLAVDINSTNVIFERTPEFKWLQQHAHEYGFILRYPKGKEWITGYSYEPWHYRYVGVDVAKTIYEENITYEEYYTKYISVNEFR